MLKHKFFIWNRPNHYGTIANIVIARFIIFTMQVIDYLNIPFVSILLVLVLSYYALMTFWQVLLNLLNAEMLPNLKAQNKNVHEKAVLYQPKRKDVTDEER